jgi:hypothetical protein
VTGLTPGTSYYFGAWSEKTGSQQWSIISVQATANTTGAPPPIAVGGKVFTINKALVLAPWLVLIALISTAVTGVILRRKKTHFSNHNSE